MKRRWAKDIRIINENIPASDLAFQWDNVCSVLEHEMAPTTPDQSPAQSHSPTERFRELFSRFQQNIPDEIPLGIHFCYGDAGHKHMMQPPDLGVSVKLANEALDVATRPIDWIHMPVPMSRNDEDYFRPLRGLNDNTRLFLGLVHHTDGVEGTVKRIQSAKKFKKGFWYCYGMRIR